jgi:hypothetical protein
MLFKIITIILLLLIFLQDLKGRAVYWFLFPLLALLLTVIRIQQHLVFVDFLRGALLNLGFITLQLLTLTLYFSLKNRRWVNITAELLGWGDILFFLSIAFYLPFINYLFFYIVSLTGVLLAWLIWRSISQHKHPFIPLAGLLSLAVAGLLTADWWFKSFNLADDAWLLNLIAK